MKLLNKFARFLIFLYQKLISPILGPRCRFTPSCSAYSMECFSKFPFFKALWYSIRRISKCHPLNSGGYDPVKEVGCCHEH